MFPLTGHAWDIAVSHIHETRNVWRYLEGNIRLTPGEIFLGRTKHNVGVYIVDDFIIRSE